MVSHDMLSVAQRSYLTSQNKKITNLPEQRIRIIEKVERIFNTMKIILESKNIDQEFKDTLFDPQQISTFINRLTEYDSESTMEQESNKQAIIIDLMNQSLSYFQSRYNEIKFIKKEITNFQQFGKDIIEFTENKINETEAQKMYKTRKSLIPPLLYPTKDTWTTLCMSCHSYSTLGKDKDDSIKRIRHTKNCSYHKENKRLGKEDKKRIYIQFFKTTPPKKKN